MTLLIVLLAVAAVCVAAGVAVSARRRRLRALAARPVIAPPLPDVLVPTVEAPISIDEAAVLSLPARLASARGVFDRVRAMTGTERLSADQLEVVEEVLIRSDLGVAMATSLVERLRERGAPEGVAAATRAAVLEVLGDKDRTLRETADEGRVAVWLFVGVNGVGKTTTIGKLSHRAAGAGHRVVIAAGDTFRAAAADQLALWAERTGADLVRATEGADPGSVVHDALGRASARHADLVLADTAGRRHTSSNLLDELSKIRRVADRAPGQVLETLLVLDATTGQNALTQAREFHAAAQLTGIVLTKLDGTARGGIVVAVERELGVPVKLVGVGESVDDLIDFVPHDFVEALLGG